MTQVRSFAPGGYRYLKGVFQYSAGVAAERGFEIERVHLARPVPLAQGFSLIERHLAALGRPPLALCGCELRSPAQFTEQGFHDLNKAYVDVLERWGIYRDGDNPVARSNVCPAIDAPAVPVLYAFSYTVPASAAARASFVIAGGADCPEGRPNYRDHIVRKGDTSLDGLREKVRFVVKEMEHRLNALGASWRDASVTQAYTVHDIGPLIEPEIMRRGAAPAGLTLQHCRPPVVGLEYEMDVRSPARELVL